MKYEQPMTGTAHIRLHRRSFSTEIEGDGQQFNELNRRISDGLGWL